MPILPDILEEVAVSLNEDERGKVVNFKNLHLDGLHVVEMKAGAVRGNHVHEKDEIVCVISGSGHCEIIAEDQDSGEHQHLTVEGILKTCRIKAGKRHTIKNRGKDTFYVVCFYEDLATAHPVR